MSRHGYVDDCDYENWDTFRWRGMVASATRGKRGQKFFRDLIRDTKGDALVYATRELEAINRAVYPTLRRA